jgi:hypothetical protein
LGGVEPPREKENETNEQFKGKKVKQ